VPRPLDDTIAAIATAPGPAGLAVVRVSGAQALGVADRVFRGSGSGHGAGAGALAAAASHTLHHGWAVHESGARLDEVVAAVFRAPRSYTREDVIELSCHGGDQNARRVLAALTAAGARLAGPGEFTLRAFVHGRLDLAQAEAVADLIHAETSAAADLALAQLAGELSRRIAALAERVTDALATVEAHVDFAEDVGGVEVPQSVHEELHEVAAALAALIASGAYARAVRGGVPAAIVGRPNAGKSSLFNALLGEARAIVAPVAGTTRDRVSEAIEIAGVRVMLSDTAGLRERSAVGDPIEAVGMQRAIAALEGAALVLWVIDASAALAPEDLAVAARVAALPRARVVVALNKADLPTRVNAADVLALVPAARVQAVSALSGAGVAALRDAIAQALGAGERGAAGVVPALAGAVADPRHAEALARACDAVRRASEAAVAALPGEIVALELREALAAIGEVTGTHIGEDLLDRIFNRFCIGK
jgi:tRNA modification GTPase